MPIVVTTEWLREFVPTDLPAKEMAERLSDVGLATDSFEEIEAGEARLELEAPTNRGDCWSVLGVARELAAALGVALKMPVTKYEDSGAPASDDVAVTVEDADLCPRYTARLIRGVKVGPSPEWMQKRLEAVGIRPISNVVDVTNYVLVEMGQPLHAFDMALLSDGKGGKGNEAGKKTIIVRRAREKEKLPLLDETTKELTTEDLVIADAGRAVALAGVMGGADTEIGATTRDVLLESAQFNQISVRRTARRHGCPTESSVRFEHGVDPVGVDRASRRAAYLFAEVAGGKVAPGVVGPDPEFTPPEITLRHSRVSKLLCGSTAEIADDEIGRILTSLGLELVREEKGQNAEGGTVTVWRAPSWRQELKIEVDLIEEVARVYGYNRIPGRPSMRVFAVRPHPMFEARRKVRDVLTSLGYTEVCGASFFSEQLAGFWRGAVSYDAQPLPLPVSHCSPHSIRNPVRSEEDSLRTSLIPSLLAAKSANQKLGRKRVRIFEAAPVCAQGASERVALLDDGIEGSDKSGEEVLRRAKGALDALVERFCADGRAELVAVTEQDLAETDCAYEIMLDDTSLGLLGTVNRDTAEAWQLETRPALLEIDLRALASKAKGVPQAGDLPRFPGIARDVALLVEEAKTWAEIDADARGLARHTWRSAPRFLSMYRGEQVGAGKKSIAFRVVYRAPNRTLTDDDVKPVHDEFVSKLCASLGAELRK